MESLYLSLHANPFSDADLFDYQSDSDNEMTKQEHFSQRGMLIENNPIGSAQQAR